ncbi:MAG: hypothetical protein HFJ52_04045 [Clostridia bacterium]|nr:hypothetical protein [Clostridia bacterium]
MHKGERVLTKEENAEYNRNLQKPRKAEDKNKDENKGRDRKDKKQFQLILNIDTFVNNSKEDIKELGEELAFVFQKAQLAKGGA